jgi:hypothetical protein
MCFNNTQTLIVCSYLVYQRVLKPTRSKQHQNSICNALRNLYIILLYRGDKRALF